MTVIRWRDASRTQLSTALPNALVIVPVGAVEQHGPHLPTGTDAIAVAAVVDRAVERVARQDLADIVVTPVLPVGASDHHFPFGATLSLTVETMTSVLIDLARSIAAAGGRRILFVNGHGGNRGPCHAAALAASTRHGIFAGYIDYWAPLESDTAEQLPIPGHAGAFESSLIACVEPTLVGPLPQRATPPAVAAAAGMTVHAETIWRTLDGYTDNPSAATADAGRSWLDECAAALASRIVQAVESS